MQALDGTQASSRRPSARRRALFAGALLAAIAVFHLATLREGHDWSGDFSMYVRLAANMVEGRAITDTGYIYNPDYPSLGPPVYPPVYPLMLAPVYAAWGLNLMPMKALGVLCFIALLCIFHRAHAHKLPFPLDLLALAVIGLNPFFWEFKDKVLSDVPFALFLYLALLFMARADAATRRPASDTLGDRAASARGVRRCLRGVGLGLVMYLAYGTRTLGVVIPATLAAWELLRTRRISRRALVACAVFVVLACAQAAFWPGVGGYADQFDVRISRIPVEVERYANMFNHDLFENGHWAFGRTALFLLASVLALVGFVGRVRRRVTPFEVFPFLYVAVILAWPSNQGTRFLIPLIPLYMLCALEGARRMGALVARRDGTKAAAALAALLLLSYAGRYARTDFGPLREGIGKAETVELFDFVRTRTEPDAVILFPRPRVLALYTVRRAAAPSPGARMDALERLVRETGATHAAVFSKDRRPLNRYIEENPDRFALVFSNADFRVYRRLSAGTVDDRR